MPATEFVEIGPGMLRSSKCGHEFPRHDAIKTLVDFSHDQTLLAFSHWCQTVRVRVSIGNISRTELPLPDSYAIFAAPLPALVVGEGDHHFFPHLFMIDQNWLSIGTTAAGPQPANPVGAEMEILVTVYAYDAGDAQGWKRLLYDALSELSEHHWDLSVFKLETAVHLYADSILKTYLAQRLNRRLVNQILRGARPSAERQKFIKNIYLELINEEAENRTNELLHAYREQVKKPRDSFAHDNQESIHPDQAHNAFKAAFEVLWMLDELGEALST